MKKLILILWIAFLIGCCDKTDHYKKGMKLFELELYEEAVEEFDKVHSSSRAYPEAQRYIEGCNTILRLNK